jgi:hypothetical protein
MHGPVFVILMAIAVVAGVVLLVRKLRAPKEPDAEPASAAEREDVNDPEPGSRAPSGRRSR